MLKYFVTLALALALSLFSFLLLIIYKKTNNNYIFYIIIIIIAQRHTQSSSVYKKHIQLNEQWHEIYLFIIRSQKLRVTSSLLYF